MFPFPWGLLPNRSLVSPIHRGVQFKTEGSIRGRYHPFYFKDVKSDLLQVLPVGNGRVRIQTQVFLIPRIFLCGIFKAYEHARKTWKMFNSIESSVL